MDVQEKAIRLIQRFEGFSETAYKCPAGVWTIGYGRTGKEVKAGLTSTMAVEEEWLRKRVSQLTSSITEDCPALNANQIAALTSFAYNVGWGAYLKSTLRNYCLRGDWELASEEFPKWRKANGSTLLGLVKRRTAEQLLFQSTVTSI